MARFLSRQWRIDFLSRQLDRNAKHMYPSVVSLEDGRIMIEVKDRRDAAPYSRLYYSPEHARALAQTITTIADISETRSIADEVRDVREQMS